MQCTIKFDDSDKSDPSIFTYQNVGDQTISTLTPNSNWKITFSINYGTQAGVTLPDKLKDLVLVDGDYSVTSIYLDYGSVSLNASTTDWSDTGLAKGVSLMSDTR